MFNCGAFDVIAGFPLRRSNMFGFSAGANARIHLKEYVDSYIGEAFPEQLFKRTKFQRSKPIFAGLILHYVLSINDL